MNSSDLRLPENIVAASDEMREIIGVVRTIAPTMITVLLWGESGTGKEVIARLIHDWSRRKDGPFITVNCGAIPEGLIESELFGHEKGAFTGAASERKGYFESAEDGTIFLDEIGEMPLSAQVKLLRVLETGTFMRVGSSKERKSNARIIAATNRDLEQDVRTGKFRQDLYYRLRAVMLRLPPLRNRREDIPFLAESILRDMKVRHQLPSIPHISADALSMLANAEWRGNIRELRNTLEELSILSFAPDRAVPGEITADDAARIIARNDTYHIEHHPFALVRQDPVITDRPELALIYKALIELRSDISALREIVEHSKSTPEPLALPARRDIKPLADMERDAIREAMIFYNGDRNAAAHALGISTRTLYRKLQEYGL